MNNYLYNNINYYNYIKSWNDYYNYIKEGVPWGYNADENDYHIKDFLGYCNFNRNSKLLDVGCGHGKNSKIAYDKGFFYYGIDIGKHPIEYAKKKYNFGKWIVGNVLDYDFGNDKFDIIVDAGCIHVNPPLLIKRFLFIYYNLLKNKGKIFIRIFKNENYNNNLPLFYIDNKLPVRGYSKKFLSKILKEYFFVEKIVEDNEYYENDIYYIYLSLNQ